jgi:AcrR family transcriptional regulator
MAPATSRKPRADGLEARTRVLDSAEYLFARRGFHGTSVRDITEHAQLRLAAVNYHFVSKEALFREVFARRAQVLNADRLALLALVPLDGSSRRRVRAVVHAFVAPVAERARESPGFRSYLALVAQAAGSRIEPLEGVADLFNPLALRFVEALASIFTACSQRRLLHGYQFLLAPTLVAFSNNRRLESLSGGALRSNDYAAIRDDLIEFASAGLLRLGAD